MQKSDITALGIPGSDTDTKYGLAIVDHKLSIVENGGNSSVDIPDDSSPEISGRAFLRYFRAGGDYWWEMFEDDEHTLDIYMDTTENNDGLQEADRDYVVIINNCTNMQHFYEAGVSVTAYSSGDTRSISTIRRYQAQHADVRGKDDESPMNSYSWTTTCAVLVKKGEHIKFNVYVDHSNGYGSNVRYRVHEFVATWIPVNVT